MRAAILRAGEILVDEVADPEPGPGEVLVRTLACGICGSDLHARAHTHAFAEAMNGHGTRIDPDADLVMGHEFCAEILDHGPGTARRLATGTHVCSMPALLRQGGPETVGYSAAVPGGFAERMLLTEALLLPVPAGVTPALAALTEPLAVGAHAVARAALEKRDVALVIGCGPVGLAVILALKARGAGPVLAADPSPTRRAMAVRMGADEVIDPSQGSPYGAAQRAAHTDDASQAVDPLATLRGRPLQRPTVIFECVGVPGMLEQICVGAPTRARVVVVGVCMQPDTFRPLLAVGKELEMRFVMTYTPQEFAATLGFIADAGDTLQPLITAAVGLGGVADAFEQLKTPEKHVKIQVQP